MAWYIEVLKMGGKQAAELLVDQFGGEDAKQLMRKFFGKEGESQENLQRLERQIQEVAQVVKAIDLRTMFENYNNAAGRLESLNEKYQQHKDKPPGDLNKQNACRDALGAEGAYEQARRMIYGLCHLNMPSNKSFLQEYSDLLMQSHPDVYSYCDRLDALVEHLKLNLLGAAALRKACYEDFADKGTEKDVEVTPQETKKVVDRHYAEFLGVARGLRARFDGYAESGEYIRLQHRDSVRYLTAYEPGNPTSWDAPFGDYVKGDHGDYKRGMPQIYGYRLARGQKEKYTVTISAGWSSQSRIEDVSVDGVTQEWRVIKVGGNGEPVKFMFELRRPRQPEGGADKPRKALDGVKEGRVYLSPLTGETGESHMWWQPIQSKNGAGQFEPTFFLLKHHASEFALDSDGVKVYADKRKPDNNNAYMKWRLNPKGIDTLYAGEFLSAGEELVSQNQRYALRYEQSGNLELKDKNTGRLLWFTATGGKGAFRCVMQREDGNFVVYAKPQVDVWATNRYGPQFAGSRLVLRDDAVLEVLDMNNGTVWRMKPHLPVTLLRVFSTARALRLHIARRLFRRAAPPAASTR